MTTSAHQPREALLLDRERETASLADLLDDVAAGRGRALLVEAPAGLGKSALLGRLAGLAEERSMTVLTAAGRELESTIGFGVARSLFEPWLLAAPDRRDLITGPAAAVFDVGSPAAGSAAFDVVHALHRLAGAVAEQGPTVLAVDDTHWADAESLQLLVYLVGRLAGRRLGVAVAARPGEGPRDRLEQLATDPLVTVLHLEPLGPGSAARLVLAAVPAADAALCARCHALTGGNPFQLRTLIAALTETPDATTPAGLEQSADRAARSLARTLQRRLRARSEGARRLADVLAVAGTGLTLGRAAGLLALDPAVVLADAEELAAADLLRLGGPGDTLDFVHPLVRRAIHETIPAAERAAWHTRLAGDLAAAGAPEEQVAVHLLHTAPSGDDAVVETLRRAASRALGTGAAASAATYLKRALDEIGADSPRRGALLAELGSAQLVAGEGAAVATLEQAVALGDPEEAAVRRLGLGRALHDFADLPRACTVLEQALAELPAGPRHAELALDLEAAYLTSAVGVQDRLEDAHRRADAVLADPPDLRSAAGRALASKALSMRTYDGGTREHLVALARALIASADLSADLASQAVSHAIIALGFSDEYAAARHALDQVAAEARRVGSTTWQAATNTLSARQLVWTGPLDRAVDEATAAVDTLAAARQLYLPSAMGVLVRGLLERDQPDEAESVLRRLADQPEPRSLFAACWQESFSRVAAARDDPATALHHALIWGQLADESRITNPAIFHWRSQAALAALQLDDRGLASRLVEEEVDLAEQIGAPRAIAVALRARAALADVRASIELLTRAADLTGRCGARVETALTLVELGAATRRAGRPGEARPILREAIVLADRVGARRTARLGRAELTIAGGRSPAREQPGLTAAERRVVELAATGLSNRQIALRLHVTVKNVEWHLTNAYRRLGISRRAELVAALGEAGGHPSTSHTGGQPPS